jgi:steroid delta-isomerase-like uncharacterized protein
MSTEENKTIIQRYLTDALEAVKRGNVNATDEFLAEDATFYDPGRPPSIGREAQKQRGVGLLAGFPDVRFVIEDLIAEGDKVVARWTMRATHSGPFMGLPPTGKQIAMNGITIYRLTNGQIGEARSELDQMGLLQQLGVMPAPKQ